MKPIEIPKPIFVKVGRKNKYQNFVVGADVTLREFFEMYNVAYQGVVTSINGVPLDEKDIDKPIGNFGLLDIYERYVVWISQPTETF